MDLEALVTAADPVRDTPLPGPESQAGEQLYHQITARPARRSRATRPARTGPRRRGTGRVINGRTAAGLAAAGLAAAVGIALTLPSGPAARSPQQQAGSAAGPGTRPVPPGRPAFASLAAAALKAAHGKGALRSPGRGQYFYMEDIESRGARGCGGKMIRQMWIAADASGRQKYYYPGGGCAPRKVTFGPGGFPWTFGYYATSGLPDKPQNLEQAIVRRLENGHAFTSATFVYAAYFLNAGTPPAIRAALYRVIENLPGMKNLGRVTDALGRPGSAVGYTHEGTTEELIFDPATSAALEWEIVAAGPKQEGGNYQRAGTVLLDTTYVVSGIVNSDTTALHAPNTLVGG